MSKKEKAVIELLDDAVDAWDARCDELDSLDYDAREAMLQAKDCYDSLMFVIKDARKDYSLSPQAKARLQILAYLAEFVADAVTEVKNEIADERKAADKIGNELTKQIRREEAKERKRIREQREKIFTF